MKERNEIKYPSSARLFKFCRKVLDSKYGGVRVIDQDVGQILGFDPADCSHWKKGKKNIRSIQAVKNISSHLEVDEKIIIDIIMGEVDETEAYFEFTGYGSFELAEKDLDAAKKEYYRINSASWTKSKELKFIDDFSPNTNQIKKAVNNIIENVKFYESPLYVPEVLSHYPNIKLIASEEENLSKHNLLSVKKEKDSFLIFYPKDTDTKPHVRFQIVKALAQYFLPEKVAPHVNLENFVQDVKNIESNIFALHLLLPEVLIKKEMKNINVTKDITTQLAETFWVSKSFVNHRLKDYFNS